MNGWIDVRGAAVMLGAVLGAMLGAMLGATVRNGEVGQAAAGNAGANAGGNGFVTEKLGNHSIFLFSAGMHPICFVCLRKKE